MQLHQLKPKYPLKKKKPRIGRGGKRGTFSGRGSKGQKARAGHRIRPSERDYIIKIPKLRGWQNKPISIKSQVVNVGDLEKCISGNIINPEILIKAGLIKMKRPLKIKILGDGEIKKKFEVSNILVSKSAKQKIEAAGGAIISKAQNAYRKL
jgi:large subunit ribosomal protein L15